MRAMILWFGAVALFFTRLCSAAGLAECVPGDVGICIQGRELPRQVRSFFAGPIGKRALAHHAVVDWRNQRDGDLKRFMVDLEAHFQMPFADLCEGVAGREILLGVWPETEAGAGDSPALLLVHARDPATLKKAFQAIHDEQERHGRARPAIEAMVLGKPHTLQVIAPEKGKGLLYLATADAIGLLSNSEPLAIAALERHAAQKRSGGKPSSGGALASSASYQAAMNRLPSEAALTIFINARAWDPTLAASIARPDGDQELSPQDREKLLTSWRATEYLVAGVSLGDQVRAEGAWQVDYKKLPPAARELADAISGRAGFLEFVPKHALIAVSGRAQWGRLARLVWGELARGDGARDDHPSAAAAADVLMQLLEKLGPDCGAFVSAAPAKGPEKLPLELAFGFETRSRLPKELASTAADTVDQSLRSALAMVTVVYNQDHDTTRADLRTERVGGVPMTTLTGIVELGDVQPTYAMTAHGVLVGTSRDAVAAAATTDAERSLGRAERIARVLSGSWSSPSQVFFFDARGFRELLQAHPGFAHHLAKKSGETPEQAKQGLEELARLLALADTVVAACRVEPDGVSVILHVSAE